MFNPDQNFRVEVSLEDVLGQKIKLLEKDSVKVVSDTFENIIGAYILTFSFENANTTIRIKIIDDERKAIEITNMTTLPDEAKGKGYGRNAVEKVIQWAKENGFNKISAVGIAEHNEGFWEKLGFVKDEKPNNVSNDFVYSK